MRTRYTSGVIGQTVLKTWRWRIWARLEKEPGGQSRAVKMIQRRVLHNTRVSQEFDPLLDVHTPGVLGVTVKRITTSNMGFGRLGFNLRGYWIMFANKPNRILQHRHSFVQFNGWFDTNTKCLWQWSIPTTETNDIWRTVKRRNHETDLGKDF